MDALENISVETSLDDELAFLKFAYRNRGVRMISVHATIEGPTYLSPADLPTLKKSSRTDTFLLWNTRIASPLCWELYPNKPDAGWRFVDPQHAKTQGHPSSNRKKIERFESFRRHPISEELFKKGRISTLLSPVVEVFTPSSKQNYFMITSEFSNRLNGVWVVWDAFEQVWKHENRPLEEMFEGCWEQSAEFIRWQEQLFGWIRKNWASKILTSESYRY